ncbi:hypothetical protein OK016_17390 [Vibrio chagasii]|nr:hypothetical protein [Vibrio chagasii]
MLRDKRIPSFSQGAPKLRKALEDKDQTDAERQQAERDRSHRKERSSFSDLGGVTLTMKGLSRKAKSMEKQAKGLRSTMTRLDSVEPWTLSLSGESMSQSTT